MKTYNELKEEYFARVKNKFWDTTFEMFKNPSRKELTSLGNHYRFLIFTSGNMYAAEATVALHHDMIAALKENKKGMVATTGYFRGNRLSHKLAYAEMQPSIYDMEYAKVDMDAIREMLSKHKHMKRAFPNWSIVE